MKLRFSGEDAAFIYMCMDDVELLQKIAAARAKGEHYDLTEAETKRLFATIYEVLDEGE